MKTVESKIIKILEKTHALKYGDFTLASGDKSPFYIDLRVIPNYSEAFKEIIEISVNYLHRKSLEIEGVVGIPLAGIPFATMIAYQLHKPFYILRKEPKKHGLQKIIEGELKPKQKILLVDDLISSGFSKLYAINALREEGADVANLFVYIDRSPDGLTEFEKKNSINVHYLINKEDILSKIKV
ncbi:MAG: orotate phosphoribosyltransferase [Candidatus Thorarchaeota archaeon]